MQAERTWTDATVQLVYSSANYKQATLYTTAKLMGPKKNVFQHVLTATLTQTLLLQPLLVCPR